MSITTIRPPKKRFNLKKIFTFLSIFLCLVALINHYQEDIPELLGISKKSTLTINTLETGAKVYLNGELIGETPLENYIFKSGVVNLSIKGEINGYNTSFNAYDNSENIIYRELGLSKELSSGVNIWESNYDNKKVEVLVYPRDSKIFVNDKEVNEDNINNLESGTYKFKVESSNYKDLVFTVNIRKGFKTNIEVKLPPLPSEKEITKLSSYENLYVIKSSNPDVFSYSKDWIEYLSYFQKRRGILIQDLGLTKDNLFEYFIDSDGRVFDKNGNQIDDFDSIGDLNLKKTALLHRDIGEEVINEKNKLTVSALYGNKKEKIANSSSKTSESEVLGSETSQNQGTKKLVVVKAEWLRLRQSPNGNEVGKVLEGEELELISDTNPEWYEIKTKDGKTGFISKQFSEIKN